MNSAPVTGDVFADLSLVRFPDSGNPTLLPCNGADRLLLSAAPQPEEPAGTVLLLNDEHGALAAACQYQKIVSWTDSLLSQRATMLNLERNQILPEINFVTAPESPIGTYDSVLIRVPKSIDLFEFQIRTLRLCLTGPAKIYTAAMDKHLSPRIMQILENSFTDTMRQQGRHKAHCFTSVHKPGEPVNVADVPFYQYTDVPQLNAQIAGAPGCFSRSQLDGGARLVLDNLARCAGAEHVADVGCGNGVLGIGAALNTIALSTLTMLDESAMAVVSARKNVSALLADCNAEVQVQQSDGLENYRGTPPDLILLNPPFHQQFSIDESLGFRLLKQCAKAVTPTGRVWLVINRHLRYDQIIKRLFLHSEVVASSSKFVLWELTRPQR